MNCFQPMVTRTVSPRTLLRFECAGSEDDEAILRLLRETPLQGDVALTFEREPSCFVAGAAGGDRLDFVIARHGERGDIVGCGSRAIYDAYLNGERRRLGYLSQLRVRRGTSSPALVRDGYRFLQRLDGHETTSASRATTKVPFYVTTIVADNVRARRLLERNLPGMPKYRPVARMRTLIVPVRPDRQHRTTRVERGATTFHHRRDEIAWCLQRNAQRHQFARHWDEAHLCSAQTPYLFPDDWCVALRDGDVAGTLAVWDQRPFKQVVVRGYSRRLATLRPLLNAIRVWTGAPHLPRPGTQLRHASVSHLAVDDNDAECFLALLAAAHEIAAAKGVESLILGFTTGHPLLNVAERHYRCRAYESIAYVVYWEDAAEEVSHLDARVPHLEVATL